jgi:hypothetical protein
MPLARRDQYGQSEYVLRCISLESHPTIRLLTWCVILDLSCSLLSPGTRSSCGGCRRGEIEYFDGPVRRASGKTLSIVI